MRSQVDPKKKQEANFLGKIDIGIKYEKREQS